MATEVWDTLCLEAMRCDRSVNNYNFTVILYQNIGWTCQWYIQNKPLFLSVYFIQVEIAMEPFFVVVVLQKNLSMNSS